LIVNGTKSVETRTYPIPQSYIGIDMALIETPGREGKFKARVVAIIRFAEPFKYTSKKDFYKDAQRHQVSPDSLWAWDKKPKWGWPVSVIRIFETPIVLRQRKGIRFTKDIALEI
jgi:hypothetical protein